MEKTYTYNYNQEKVKRVIIMLLCYWVTGLLNRPLSVSFTLLEISHQLTLLTAGLQLKSHNSIIPLKSKRLIHPSCLATPLL